MMQEIFERPQTEQQLVTSPCHPSLIVEPYQRLELHQNHQLASQSGQNNQRAAGLFEQEPVERMSSNQSAGGPNNNSTLDRQEVIKTELQIQSQNQMVEIEDRKRIFKKSITLFGVYSFVFIALLLILRYAQAQYASCGIDVK
mmetsp:Transcript_7381/g.8904  ORF Transcript_7381/g.8904 Transcript_7381/m.8904 type:complete len:143 (-) Transcript_7381:1273-1701(-)